jgi:hypothetical protein
MKKNAYFVALALAVVLVGNIMCPTVNAESVDISTTVADNYTITAPKEISLSKTSDTAFDVEVKGDISGNKHLVVSAPEVLTLRSAGHTSIDTAVTLDKSEFAYSDVSNGYTISGSIAKPARLSSGTWTGTVTFVADLTETEGN